MEVDLCMNSIAPLMSHARSAMPISLFQSNYTMVCLRSAQYAGT